MWLDFLNVPFPKPLTFQFCYNTLINKKVINKYVSAKTYEKDYTLHRFWKLARTSFQINKLSNSHSKKHTLYIADA